MASGFPGSIDNFTDPLTTSALNSPSHAGQHQDLNDAVEKIETYMGLVKVIPTSATNGTVAANGTVTIGNAVSSVTVSGAFSSLYDNYRVIVSGGSCSTTPSMTLTLGSTATGYYICGLYVQLGVGTLNGLNVSNGTAWTNMGRASGSGISMSFDLLSPNLARNTGVQSHTTDYGTTGYYIAQSGFLNDVIAYTSFTISPASGTLTGGTIRVYGYRN